MDGSVIIYIVIIGVIVFALAFVLLGIFLIAPSSKGNKGLPGDVGVDGSKGWTGPRGRPGNTPQFVITYKGDPGYTGPVGETGHGGAVGMTGFTGDTGFAGVTGINFYPTLILDGSNVITSGAGFTGATGTVGDDNVLRGLGEVYNKEDVFTKTESAGSVIDMAPGQYKIDVTLSIESLLDTQTGLLEVYVEDDATTELDAATISIPPAYLDQSKDHTVSLYIEHVAMNVKLYVRNKTIVNTFVPDVNKDDYAFIISRQRVLMQAINIT